MALQRGAPGRVLKIPGALAVQITNKVIVAEVRRVRHRWAPVAVLANQDIFVEERGIALDERADGIEIISPDRVRELYRVDEPGPARCLIASREHELCVGEFRSRGVNRLGMMLA